MTLIKIRGRTSCPYASSQGVFGAMFDLQSLDVARTAMAMQSSLRLWGYLDPGTGSMVFQLLVAGLFSTMFFLKSWVRHFRDNLLLMKSRKS
jgi:hypothetical protein